VVLSRWIATNPTVVLGETKKVLELGAGCGLVGLVAARLQKMHCHEETVHRCTESSCVVLTDFNEAVLENLRRNAILNEVSQHCQIVGLDFFAQKGDSESHWICTEGKLHEQADVILAADIICQPDDAYASARAIRHCLRQGGGRAYVVCADESHRFGVDRFEDACRQAGLEICVDDVEGMYGGKLLSSSTVDLRQTSGFVDCMKLKFFTLKKPRSAA